MKSLKTEYDLGAEHKDIDKFIHMKEIVKNKRIRYYGRMSPYAKE